MTVLKKRNSSVFYYCFGGDFTPWEYNATAKIM